MVEAVSKNQLEYLLSRNPDLVIDSIDGVIGPFCILEYTQYQTDTPAYFPNFDRITTEISSS